jgi:SnoaL-like domain
VVIDHEDLPAEVATLVDRAAICDLFSQFAAATDVQDWDLVADCLAPDAVIDFSRPAWDGTKDQVWVGFDEVMANLKRGLSRHFVGHHMITNHRCVIDGDRARVVAYLRSSHLDDPHQPTSHEDQGAWYLSELARIDGRWKLAYMKPISVWWNSHAGPDQPLSDDLLTEMGQYLEPVGNARQGGNGERSPIRESELPAMVQWLADRDAIADLFSRFAASADAQDWKAFEDCFAPDIVFDRSRPTWDGEQDGEKKEAWVGLEQVLDGSKADGSKHFLGHHMLANHRCVIAGDRARAVAYLHSVHVDDPERPTDHYAHGAWYLTELSRSGDGWRFSYVKHVAVWWPTALRPPGPVTQDQLTELRNFLGAPVAHFSSLAR